MHERPREIRRQEIIEGKGHNPFEAGSVNLPEKGPTVDADKANLLCNDVE